MMCLYCFNQLSRDLFVGLWFEKQGIMCFFLIDQSASCIYAVSLLF
jgi:hypothetical protein